MRLNLDQNGLKTGQKWTKTETKQTKKWTKTDQKVDQKPNREKLN